jgi:hypothetical protein
MHDVYNHTEYGELTTALSIAYKHHSINHPNHPYAMKNLHAEAIPAQTLEQAYALLKQAAELIAPYTVALTPAERHELPKMGEKTLAFVEKAHQFAHQNPVCRPPYLDMDAFDIDFADAHDLWPLQLLARQFDEAIADTTMTAGSEAYQAALLFYSATKTAAAQNIPGAKAVYEDLRTRFPSARRKTDAAQTQAA